MKSSFGLIAAAVILAPLGGDSRQWDAETVSPGSLVAMGVNRDTLRPGDKITMGIYPLRDGRAAGAMVYVTTADGHTFGTKPEG